MGRIRCSARSSRDRIRFENMSTDFVLKILLIGDYTVGKTSLLHLLAGQKKCPKMPERYCPLSLGIRLNRKGKQVQLKIMDTGGRVQNVFSY